MAAPSIPQISFLQEISTLNPFALATALLFVGPRVIRQERHDDLSVPQGLLLPGFQVAGSPHAPAVYDYGAKLRIAPAGLSPASTPASLAASFLPDFHRLHLHQLAWRTGSAVRRASGSWISDGRCRKRTPRSMRRCYST